MNEKPGVEEDKHYQDHDNRGLGAPKENKHDQDHNNKIRLVFDDAHEKEDCNGSRSETHT